MAGDRGKQGVQNNLHSNGTVGRNSPAQEGTNLQRACCQCNRGRKKFVATSFSQPVACSSFFLYYELALSWSKHCCQCCGIKLYRIGGGGGLLPPAGSTNVWKPCWTSLNRNGTRKKSQASKQTREIFIRTPGIPAQCQPYSYCIRISKCNYRGPQKLFHLSIIPNGIPRSVPVTHTVNEQRHRDHCHIQRAKGHERERLGHSLALADLDHVVFS